MTPQLLLGDFDRISDLDELTDAERDVYVAVEQHGRGVREYARLTDRNPGTVGNLLRRARLRIDGRGGEVRRTW